MQVVIFEDYLAGELRPVTLARPTFAISLCGTNLYNLVKLKGLRVSYILRKYLEEISIQEFPCSKKITEKSLLFLNGALLPLFSILEKILNKTREGKPFLAQTDSRVSTAFFPEIDFNLSKFNERSITNFLLSQDYEFWEERFPLINYPFEIIKYNKDFFKQNTERLKEGYEEKVPGVFTGSNVKIHPTVCMDTEEGRIIIDEGTTIGPFVYLKGPLYIGKNCKVIERTSIKEMSHIGHHCKVGGEVECSIIEPYSNKQHHGFLGHSWVGSWVNMGAGTSNSDLKNTYGEVTIEYQGRRIPTGMQFLGCIIGDYSKTAINTSIFTGKIIGVASYVYGFVTTNVPSFCNYARSFGQVTEHYLPAVVRTQKRMFERRDVEQKRVHIKLLEDIYEITRDERIMSTEAFSF